MKIKFRSKEYKYVCGCTAQYYIDHRRDFPLDTLVLFLTPESCEVYVPTKIKEAYRNGFSNREIKEGILFQETKNNQTKITIIIE